MRTATGLAIWIALAGSIAAMGQGIAEPDALQRPLAPNVVLPQRRVIAPMPTPLPRPLPPQRGQVQITAVNAKVRIVDQVATTTLEIALSNPTPARLEAEMILPVPDGAAIRGFDFQGAGAEPSAQLLRREEARRIYDSIVAQTRDPALLEFIGYNLVRSSVFPVEPHGTQKVKLVYEHVCPADGERVDYVLPRTEAIDYAVPWDVTVEIVSKRALATVYSPSHDVTTKQPDDGKYAFVGFTPRARTQPGSFRVSYLYAKGDVTASVLAYPDPASGGGYFMLLAGLPADVADDRPAIRREVTLVLDRSGSMNGEKLDQVIEAAKQVLAGLDDGEHFNVIVYNEAVDAFATAPVAKSDDTIAKARAFLDSVKARGGTNIHDSLLEALRQKPTDGALPIVLFLTDGRPTIGTTAEKAIRELATKHNPHKRRVFTFGVGDDLNSPLLENLAYESRAVATYVAPQEDVEVKVAGMFRRLSGPLLADPALRVLDSSGAAAVGRVIDVMPVRLPDVFDGDQVLVLGRYVGEQAMTFEIAGNLLGKGETFRFAFDPAAATTRHAYVPRLWATRKIGVLIDAIRTSGADPQTAANDPNFKELVDEIVRLSTEFGVLTEYTAFFAREGTNLNDRADLVAMAEAQLRGRAIAAREGKSAINQDSNTQSLKAGAKLNYRNEYLDAEMRQAQAPGAQPAAGETLWKSDGRWVDAKLVARQQKAAASNASIKPDREVEFASDAYFDIARQLAAQNRQAIFCLDGDALVELDGQAVLLKAAQ